MTIAEYISNQLFNHGVRFVFGIPGGPSIPYLEAFKAAGIEFILTSKQSWKNLSPYGTMLYQEDLFGADTFLGVKVVRADSHESMRKAVIEALSINEPVIINAVIDPEDYKWLIVRR